MKIKKKWKFAKFRETSGTSGMKWKWWKKGFLMIRVFELSNMCAGVLRDLSTKWGDYDYVRTCTNNTSRKGGGGQILRQAGSCGSGATYVGDQDAAHANLFCWSWGLRQHRQKRLRYAKVWWPPTIFLSWPTTGCSRVNHQGSQAVKRRDSEFSTHPPQLAWQTNSWSLSRVSTLLEEAPNWF